MTREELLRVLSFVDRMRTISIERTAISGADPRWNIVSYTMRRHLEGKPMTMTSMTQAAGVPYGTARRRINELIEEGLLLRRPRSKSGKSFSLHPTRKLIEEFQAFAMKFKAMVGSTFGFDTGGKAIEDFYFGGYYMASRILSYPSAMRAGAGFGQPVRILCAEDPTFRTLSCNTRILNYLCGTELEIRTLPLDALHAETVGNHARGKSEYDLVAVDLPWMGEMAEAGAIRPLDDLIARERYNSSDFHTAAWKGAAWNGRQYGLPIQPTAELLFCRKDLFAEAELNMPATTDEVLFAARRLHRSGFRLSGVVMNYGRGTPVAHTFVQTMTDFGQPVIDLAPVGDDYAIDAIEGERFRPMIETEAGRRTAEYLLELLDYSHPESLRCDWDRRIALFSGGEAAMCYGWSVRAAAFELNKKSPAHGKVAFMPHPPAPGNRAVSPIGGFALAIPAAVKAGRAERAWKVMEYLTQPEMMKWYVQQGSLTSPRFSTSADPEVQALSQMIREIDAMERCGTLQIYPRPPIPEFSDILGVLGTEIHQMLLGETSVASALASAQARVDAIMRANGRY